MIRVAIADDSPFTCRLLEAYIESDQDCQVVGSSHDAESTLALVRRTCPDVLTLDLEMPGSAGLDLLKRVTEESPVAVVVVSGVSRSAAATTLRALELGAIDFVLKFTPDAPSSPESLRREIVTKVKTAAGAREIAVAAARARPRLQPGPPEPRRGAGTETRRAIVLGASTGGPQALCDLLSQLPAEFPNPCIVVQHLPPMFSVPFAAQLARYTQLRVRVAEPNDRLDAAQVFVTPGGFHLFLRAGGRLELRPTHDRDVYRPSINTAMVSAAEYCGPGAVGVVLSGMGSDGAEGLRCIRACGGTAYVQDPATCVVESMPARAMERAGADFVAAPKRIGALLAGRGHHEAARQR